MSIGVMNIVDWCDSCSQSSPIPNPLPDSCILQLDGTGDYLGWSNADESDISDIDEDGSRLFWFRNKNLVGQDFTLLSYGKELAGVLKWTTEIKYLASTNTLLYMMKDYTSSPAKECWAEFDLFTTDNEPITGLSSVNDKWTKCSGSTDIHGFVFFETNNFSASSNPFPIDNRITWNGEKLTLTRSSGGQVSGWNPNQGTNFITLGGYGKTPTTGTANADYSTFIVNSSAILGVNPLAALQYSVGYPCKILVYNPPGNFPAQPRIQPVFAALTEDLSPGFQLSPMASGTTLFNGGNPSLPFPSVAGTLGDNATYSCAPATYPCAVTPPTTFTVTVKSTDYHPLPANCDSWTMNVTLNGALVCEVVKNSSAVATVTNPSFQVLSTDVIEATVTALAPQGGGVPGSCSSQYSTTEVFMQTGFGNTNVNPYTTRLNFSSVATQSYSFSPVANVDDTINIYGTPIV